MGGGSNSHHQVTDTVARGVKPDITSSRQHSEKNDIEGNNERPHHTRERDVARLSGENEGTAKRWSSEPLEQHVEQSASGSQLCAELDYWDTRDVRRAPDKSNDTG